ncbi:MAG: IMP dehydrogenase [Pseudomonadota bacterium]
MLRIVQEALTFDDVLLVPGHSTILPRETNLSTKLTKNLSLNIPLLSSAMDTVTNSTLAIAIASEGGVGVIHKNSSIEEQTDEVKLVKKYESGVIQDPITVSPNMSIGDVLEITRVNNISGVPVVEDENLQGIVTSRDLRFETRLNEPVTKIMTPKEKLVTVQEGATREQAKELLHEHRIEKILVVNSKFQLRGMITVKDIQKSTDFPNACKDSQGRLIAAAAVGVTGDTEERISSLVGANVDIVVVDTAHGHAKGVLDRVAWVKKKYPDLQVIAGNIATAEAAKALAASGVDGVKVGIGPGSICTTRIVAGVGVPQITAISDVSAALKKTNIPVVADGGIRFSGDVAKALAAGADSVMIGGLFAGTLEAPGEVELFQGRSYKSYRGMGSLSAMAKGSSERYFQDSYDDLEKFVPEGIEGRVPYKGPLSTIVHQLLGGLRSSMGYLGCREITEMHKKASFVKVTAAGMRESHVHDVSITKEAPNYRVDN